MAATEAPESKEGLIRNLSFVQGVTSSTVLVVGGSYAVGLLIVNFDLSQYGLTSLDLARAEYAMAGALWCFLTAAVCGGFDLVSMNLHKHLSEKRYLRGSLLAFLDVAVFLSTVFWVLAVMSRNVIYDSNAIPVVVALLLNGLAVRSLLANLKEIALGGTVSPRMLFDIPARLVTFFPNRLYLGVYVLVAISVYAAYVHPAIPREFGGGMKPLVTLFITGAPDGSAKELNLPVSQDNRTIGPVELLMENERFFIVTRARGDSAHLPLYRPERWLPHRRAAPAVGIDKQFVSGIIYLTDRAESRGGGRTAQGAPAQSK